MVYLGVWSSYYLFTKSIQLRWKFTDVILFNINSDTYSRLRNIVLTIAAFSVAQVVRYTCFFTSPGRACYNTLKKSVGFLCVYI